MTKDDMLHLVEDLVDSTLPLNEYCVRVYKDNGDCQVWIHHRASHGSFKEISDMYGLSEIFNSYSSSWKVEYMDSKLEIKVL